MIDERRLPEGLVPDDGAMPPAAATWAKAISIPLLRFAPKTPSGPVNGADWPKTTLSAVTPGSAEIWRTKSDVSSVRRRACC